MVIEGMHYDPACSCKSCKQITKSTTMSTQQKPILKAHLEGVEMFKKKFIYNRDGQWLIDYPAYFDEDDENKQTGVVRGYAVPNEFLSFLTTYGINLLKAAKEAGPGEKDNYFETPARTPKEWSERGRKHGHNEAVTSFISAIDEGIKEISKNI